MVSKIATTTTKTTTKHKSILKKKTIGFVFPASSKQRFVAFEKAFNIF